MRGRVGRMKWERGSGMERCIYSGADAATASFSGREHIFPKAVGGRRRLPQGWVSDQVNNRLSRLEAAFARENPLVATDRMFSAEQGRRKHKDRHKVGVFQDLSDASRFSLGMVCNGKPMPLPQIIFHDLRQETPEQDLKISIILAPRGQAAPKALFHAFWQEAGQYNGSPHCIKDQRLPAHTYLLGKQDLRWFLGLPARENAEIAKALVKQALPRLLRHDAAQFLSMADNKKLAQRESQVEAGFSFDFPYWDCFRVYAKIAMNCLAFLKGQAFVLQPAFAAVKKTILTGQGIARNVWMAEGPNPILPVLERFSQQLLLGDRCHSACFMKKEHTLYGLVALYGHGNAVVVRLGELDSPFDVNFYLCDWQHGREYTMQDCLRHICGQGER